MSNVNHIYGINKSLFALLLIVTIIAASSITALAINYKYGQQIMSDLKDTVDDVIDDGDTGSDDDEDDTTPTFATEGGDLTLDLPMYIQYDSISTRVTATPAWTINFFSSDKSTLLGSASASTDPNATLTIQPNTPLIYMSIDYGTATGYYLDDDRLSAGNPAFGSMFGWDSDGDGTKEHGYAIDLTKVGVKGGGETSKNINLIIPVWQYDTSGVTITSDTNATGITTTSKDDKYCDGYLAGWVGEGRMVKLTRIELTVNSTAATAIDYVDLGYFDLQKIEVYYAGKTHILGKDNWSWNKADGTYSFNIGVTQENEELYGQNIQYGDGMTSKFATFNIHSKCKFAAINKTFYATLEMTFMDPAGTRTVRSQITSWDSST